MNISKLSLLSGDDLYLCSIGEGENKVDYYIKNPTLRDIKELDKKKEGLYFIYLYTLSVTSLDDADRLWVDFKIWYEDIKNEWAFFLEKGLTDKIVNVIVEDTDEKGNKIETLKQSLLINDLYCDALNFFFNTNGKYLFWNFEECENDINKTYLINVQEKKINDNITVYIYNKNNFKLTAHFYNILVEYLKIDNWINPEYEFLKGGNKRAKKYILENDYRKRKRNKKPTVNLNTIVSSIIAKGQNPKEIWDYSIYLIYDIYFRLSKIIEFDNTLQHIDKRDTKKNPINWDKINWSSIID